MPHFGPLERLPLTSVTPRTHDPSRTPDPSRLPESRRLSSPVTSLGTPLRPFVWSGTVVSCVLTPNPTVPVAVTLDVLTRPGGGGQEPGSRLVSTPTDPGVSGHALESLPDPLAILSYFTPVLWG